MASKHQVTSADHQMIKLQYKFSTIWEIVLNVVLFLAELG